ncbi:hypothetical protein QR680_003432 [Steinernema hermaphroditum]|uniref:Nucleoporin Nup133/Nup155-like N-terminal domain-containing protein n=1 Tax=Steinernema hermaphroditum TaxID=289476 RepID=A0AA39H6R0_9BILA|nr:hypothetical protein QR680_003432 [Steinernema hermaphroditum]
MLANAAVIVDDCISKDRVHVDSAVKLTRDLRCNRMTKVAVSGLASCDYKEFSSLMDVREFSNIETRPIPGDLRDQMKRMRSHCGMGIFPELSRAWMTIDSDLFIWSYDSGEDLAFFDGVSSAIIATTLCRPKAGVFNDNVHFLLAVATTVEVILYAVCFYYANGKSVPLHDQDYAKYEMYLIPDPICSIALDGAVVSGMKATADGRLFFAADDALFELCYEPQTWFKNRCRKVNHTKSYGSIITNLFTKKDNIIQLVIDDERHILYTLSESKTVQVFDLGADGSECQKICEQGADALAHFVVTNTNLDGDSIKDVVTLSVVPVRESHFLNFVLVNTSGVRMYFTCLTPDTDLSYFNTMGNEDFLRISPLSLQETRPRVIRLVHLRLPRDFNTFRAHDDDVYLMCHTSDTTVLLKSGSNTRSATATFMSSANYSMSSEISENVETQLVKGLTWSIEKFDEDSSIKYITLPGMLPDMNPPITVYQHVIEPDRFFFMTSEGVAFVDRLRPTDILRNILTTFGAESKQCSAFCGIHGPKNTMTMVLDILSSTLKADQRALEMLQKAPRMSEGADRRKLCEEALGLLRRSISKVNVHSVKDLFRQVHMFESLVELALYKAASDDPQNIAVIAYREGIVSADRELAEARAKRKDAYGCILETLFLLTDPACASDLGLSEISANRHREQVLKTVMRSEDELANVEIFDWLIDHNMSNLLVESGSVYVESYLRHKVESRDDVRYQDVLWRHCERNGKFMAAAKLLHDLADGSRVDVNLRKRIAYLSQALMCCRSEQANEDIHVFVQELEDKLEVAMVQDRLRDNISALSPNDQISRAELKNAVTNLDQRIYSVNELYTDFATTFNLPLAKLSILKCANHLDEDTIRDIWVEIIDQEFGNYARLDGAFAEVFLSKLSNLSRDYKNSPIFFPTNFILQMVLTRSFEHGVNPTWLFRLHRVPKIGLSKVLDAISRQYENDADPFWKRNSRAEFYLANAVVKIGNEFSENVKSFQSMQRQLIVNKLLNLLATFSISINTVANTREQLMEFKLRCNTLQNKLDRLLSLS